MGSWRHALAHQRVWQKARAVRCDRMGCLSGWRQAAEPYPATTHYVDCAALTMQSTGRRTFFSTTRRLGDARTNPNFTGFKQYWSDQGCAQATMINHRVSASYCRWCFAWNNECGFGSDDAVGGMGLNFRRNNVRWSGGECSAGHPMLIDGLASHQTSTSRHAVYDCVMEKKGARCLGVFSLMLCRGAWVVPMCACRFPCSMAVMVARRR